MDLISIVVPVYNVEKYLDECIDSLIKQTYTSIEIILVDDGSKDKSSIICDKWKEKDTRINVIHKNNGGLSDARNKGIEKSTGKYITFIDSDDTVSSDFIEYLYNLIKKYGTRISICSHTIIGKTGKELPETIEKKEFNMTKLEALDRLLCENGFSVSSCGKLYEKSLFDNISFPKGKLCEDNGVTYKLIDQCDNIAYGPEGKYYYYKRENSIMTSKFNIKKLDLIELVDSMANDLKKYPELKQSIEKKQIVSRFSILRQIVFSDYYDSEYTDEIIKYLKLNKKSALKNDKIGKRERLAYMTLSLGKPFFRFSWAIYSKIKY